MIMIDVLFAISFVTFSFRLLFAVALSKILGGRLKGIKTIEKLLSGRPNNGRGSVIEVTGL